MWNVEYLSKSSGRMAAFILWRKLMPRWEGVDAGQLLRVDPVVLLDLPPRFELSVSSSRRRSPNAGQ